MNLLLDNGWNELPVTAAHICSLKRLPPILKDPFDRILISQAEAEVLTLVTTDSQIAAYPGSIHLV